MEIFDTTIHTIQLDKIPSYSYYLKLKRAVRSSKSVNQPMIFGFTKKVDISLLDILFYL